MTNQPNATDDVSSALALLNAISAHLRAAPTTAQRLRLLEGIADVAPGLVRVQNLLTLMGWAARQGAREEERGDA